MGRLHDFASFILFLGIFTTKLKVASAQWLQGHATFYGESDGSGTEGGACGYGSLYTDGYGIKTAALSTALFKNGQSCGGCYELVCNADVDPQWCRKGTSITITATNYCPPNYDLPNDNGGWCNPPLPHFDMSQPAFEKIAIYRGGIVPVHYRKVRCKNTGNIKFTINGRDGFELVLIHNVAGAGDISSAWIKGSKSNNWEAMTRNWGANWQSLTYYNGQSLSFRVRASDGQEVTAHDVAPSSWQFGQSFHSNVQFHI